MNVYEVYLINLLKPPLNIDDKARDHLNFILPEVNWHPFYTPLWDKWKAKIDGAAEVAKVTRQLNAEYHEQCRLMRQRWHNGEISKDEYYAFKEGGLP